MPCEWTKIPLHNHETGKTEYVNAIVCSRGRQPQQRCVVCQSARHIKLCDFTLHGTKQGQTCDRPVCSYHALHVDPDTDYCPAHARLMQEQQRAVVPTREKEQ